MSKRKGPTRIPLFGSRIPIPGQSSSEPIRISSIISTKAPRELTGKDIGKKVRVSEKEGVLRFIGKVHFAEGVWCGIELPSGGKNNGCVRGVRYFACPDSRGLMAPLSKVLLLEDTNFEDDDVSGPHSMLFGIKDTLTPKTTVHENLFEESGKRKFEENSQTNKVLIRSDTYENIKEIAKISSSTPVGAKVLKRSGTYDISENQGTSNLTYVPCVNSDSCNTCVIDGLSYLNENNFPDIVNSTRIGVTFDVGLENGSDNSLESETNATIVSKATLGSLDNTTEEFTDGKNLSKRIFMVDDSNSDGNTLEETVIYCGEQNNAPLITVQKITTPLHNTDTECRQNENKASSVFSSLKQKPLTLRLSDECISSRLNHAQVWHSTSFRPAEGDVEGSPRRRIRKAPSSFCSSLEDSTTKRDSLEYEESLGILTPEQMIDGISFSTSRTPSSENIGSLPNDLQNLISKFQYDRKSPPELPSPNLVDVSIKDVSLGLIDERILSNFTMISDTTMNLELPLDSIDNQSNNYAPTRLEQTPSPEDLPLDPTPPTEQESKTEPTKSKTTSSFINSITSITSLDTGYQGDGEMSRPGSRGPDHSPLTRRPLIRPQARRPEPMTDSDFYTESDVDIHEEHPVRGDRRARVIDGTLYGVDAQTAADIYVNNRENMDSSGIFTDIEGNTLSSADNENPDVSPSPSDASSKTISNDSQNHAHLTQKVSVNLDSENNAVQGANNIEILPKRKSLSPSSTTSTPASVRSPKHVTKEENVAKKYKMPKRNVVSKVKAVLESAGSTNNKETSRITNKKPVGRWDAVMNKISKSQVEKPNLKEVKSKVFSSNLNPNPNNSSPKAANSRLRRTRPTTKNGTVESLNSSASDLSGASPAKRIGSAKKRADVVRVTQVLTAAQLSPRSVHKNNVIAENKKNAAATIAANENKFTPKKNTPLTREKKLCPTPTITIKDCGRATVKGGRVSPGVRPPQQNRAPIIPVPRTIEALTVLLQHLVFNLDAFQTPFLKRQLEKSRLAAEKAQRAYKQLEESFELFRIDKQRVLEEQREQYQNNIADMIKQHQSDITHLSEQHSEALNSLLTEHQEFEQAHKDQLVKLRSEFTKLQKTHEQALEILREENDSIREEIDEKIEKLEMSKKESEKLQKDYQAKEIKYKEQCSILSEEIERLKEENSRMLNYVSEGKENRLQVVMAEVESLRAVLELKQTEVSDLRKALAQANQKAELLPGTIEKVSSLTARCEDLQSQLERKSLYESQLICDNKKLQESLKDEFNHSQRLQQHNEELQWKLSQNKEVVNRVLEHAEETALSRSLATSSFNERHNSTSRQIERALSFRESSLSNKSYNSLENCNRSKKSKNSYDFDFEDTSPPSSPKVKGVVEKSDSVSYVLEMEESPEIIANRIVRRSFRNPTPPKNAAVKSPVNKRPRIKITPITLSASTSSIIPSPSKFNDHLRTRSHSVQNSNNDISSSHSDDVFLWCVPACSTPHQPYQYVNDKTRDLCFTAGTHNIDLEYNDDDIKLPTLPSEIGRNDAQSLPVPPHLAGDIVVSESNSDDESSVSTSSGQL